MIDVRIKSTGVILDIAPDASFQIEIENPIFADDHCPVPFSTEISFLPTKKNKEQLGFLDAMLLPPSIKRLNAEIYASGIKILDGMLCFSSIKNGCLNYTFSGRALEDDWNSKIYEKDIYRVSGTDQQQLVQYVALQDGRVDGVFLPLLVNATETDRIAIFGTNYSALLDAAEIEHCDPEIKYHNYQLYYLSVITPAILVVKILEDELLDVDVPDVDLRSLLGTIAILAQYKTEFVGTKSGVPESGLDLARALPDITSMDLLQIISKMLCCALFRDGDKFSFRNIGAVITDSTTPLDWGNKISRRAEVSIMPSGGYKFGFANGTDETDVNIDGASFAAVDSFDEMFDDLEPTIKSFLSYRLTLTDALFSARKTQQLTGEDDLWIPQMLLCDINCSGLTSFDQQPADSDGELFDNSVDAKLVRNIPDILFNGSREEWEKQNWRMAAVVNPESLGDERGADVIIGKIEGGSFEKQLTDGSVHYEEDAECQSEESLRPESLFQNYHKAFADWCKAEHLLVSSELNLTMADIASFRMWQKIAFAGRIWIAKKLTITFYAGSGRVDSVGEFASIN